MSIVLLVIVLGILIFVHELGHFLVAKWSGIRVDEFSIGFPPRIAKWRRGETQYALGAVPFGGYVKIFGETPDEESINGPDKARSFVHKPKRVQIAVLAAGIMFNLVFAWLLFVGMAMVATPAHPSDLPPGITIENPTVYLSYVAPESPAELAGLSAGDEILEITDPDGFPLERNGEDLFAAINERDLESVSITYVHQGERQTTDVSPTEGVIDEGRAIGVTIDEFGLVSLPVHQAIVWGSQDFWYISKATVLSLGQYIGSAFKGEAEISDLTGPVGLVEVVDDANNVGFAFLVRLVAFISISLAILNLLPIPALDGGRILFVLIEAIRGKPIKPKVANMVNSIGFGLLILLMVVVTISDVVKLF